MEKRKKIAGNCFIIKKLVNMRSGGVHWVRVEHVLVCSLSKLSIAGERNLCQYKLQAHVPFNRMHFVFDIAFIFSCATVHTNSNNNNNNTKLHSPQRENISNISIGCQHKIEIPVKVVPFHLSNQRKQNFESMRQANNKHALCSRWKQNIY